MLKIEHLTKQYDGFSLDCSLEVKPGTITALIGQNGAGKSTTFKAILGLIGTNGGSIQILGKDLKNFTTYDKQELGVVLSDSGFSGWLQIKDLIPILKAMYKTFDSNFFVNHLKRFNLPENKKIKELSTGMKAKLKVLVAISHKTKLLILDEPTAGLDVVARDDVLEMLREYMEEDESRSILISSHISSDLENLCDDFYIIHHGRIILHEEMDVLLSNYGVLKVDDSQLSAIDRQYILNYKKEPYGYSLLTNQRDYYIENYKDLVIEKGSIDEVITMIVKGDLNEGIIG
ncbi:ABC transporter, ATP-binding protein [Lachnospiraceae bacterium TWA4]|nr:ABC transporter, ATP-binding protein [Lachnospiraceae bacterium TWA4]